MGWGWDCGLYVDWEEHEGIFSDYVIVSSLGWDVSYLDHGCGDGYTSIYTVVRMYHIVHLKCVYFTGTKGCMYYMKFMVRIK